MGVTRNIGKNTLGDNGKMQVHMHDYEMSSHDLSFVFRSSVAPGVLVPFIKIYAQKGDVFDISLSNKTLTHPTIGPLFGTFKLQHFVFSCPIRLYNSWLHNNKLGIGLKMSDIKLPTVDIKTETQKQGSFYYIKTSPSSLANYMGIKGTKRQSNNTANFQGVPIIAYYDIFKNYFANTQEKKFYMIGSGIKSDFQYKITNIGTSNAEHTGTFYTGPTMPTENQINQEIPWDKKGTRTYIGVLDDNTTIKATGINGTNTSEVTDWPTFWNNTQLLYVGRGAIPGGNGVPNYNTIRAIAVTAFTSNTSGATVTLDKTTEAEKLPNNGGADSSYRLVGIWNNGKQIKQSTAISLMPFDLEEIDKTREAILKKDGNEKFNLTDQTREDYLSKGFLTSQESTMGGLCVKTYDSDLFNNWVNTEYIDGAGGINEASAVTIQNGKLTMDALNLAQKVYNFLNRIAVSGGTYRDWLETAFTAGTYINRPETPMFEGGMTQLIQFDEVISNSASTQSGEYEPLGTLAGRGKDTQQKGSGKMHIKISEPSYLIGILAITPLVDYSQGNEWDMTNISTMDDWHKPALDGIGFEDSMNNQRAWWVGSTSNGVIENVTTAGKTVAWINYMTNYNKTFGTFAAGESEDFMVLNREYEQTSNDQIKDLTTYIDPTKFNRIFADTSLDAMNFWVQTACNITKRGNYSAKKIPNL